jgi:FimV-like protein
VYCDENNLKQALEWFERAVKLKDGDANLEIAKIYLQKNDRTKAVRYLKQVLRAKPDDVTEASREEAQQLLKSLARVGPPNR